MSYIHVLLTRGRAALSLKGGKTYGNEVSGKKTKDGQNPVILTFQALRIFVNNELIEIDNGLKGAGISSLTEYAEKGLSLRVCSGCLRTVTRLFALNQPLNPHGRGS
ncbi:MAG: MraW methylase family [Alphaproteobacteria bacterium]|jgi:hypothetical protein|nr:MraW methylase family [Alphaproteobacteria bacterium]